MGINPGRNQLYQRPYPDAYDLVPYPTGWRVPDFIKFSGDDNRSTWEHISQYVAQLTEASSSNSLRVHLFSLSLIGTAFSWFSTLPPNSVRSWNKLEQKFHDHFYSGDNEAKLTDLTLVKQTRDESVSDYFKRFKEVNNRCFNLSISDKDLVDVALNGLRSYLKGKLEGFDYFNLNALQLRAMNQSIKLRIPKMHISLIGLILMLLNMIPILRPMRIMRSIPLNLFGHHRPNQLLVHHLNRLKRVGKKR